MRIHHLDCVTLCPIGGRLIDGVTPGLQRGRMVCHCLLIELGSELVLVDTGFGLRDVADPRSRLSTTFLWLLAPVLRAELTAYRQIEQLGYDPRDVRHIVLTHLDFDHAGGLDDFPHARVHLLDAEIQVATAQASPLDRRRFRPQQWGDRSRWSGYLAQDGEAWFGFDAVRALDGVPPEILMVPLAGHTRGHAGVAVWHDGDWLLHAGDAYFHHTELDVDRRRCPPGLRVYQWLMEQDRDARLWNLVRLRALRRQHHDEVEVFCAHDVVEYERLTGRAPSVEVGRAPLSVTLETTEQSLH